MPQSPDQIRCGCLVHRDKYRLFQMACLMLNIESKDVFAQAVDDAIDRAHNIDIDTLWASLGEVQAEMESTDAE